MDKDVKRFLMLVVLIFGSLVIGIGVSRLSENDYSGYNGGGNYEEFTVTDLMDEKPLDSQVSVKGNVSKVLSNYTSEKGYVYQRFHLTDGKEEVLVFCSTYKGYKKFERGDRVKVEGKFQEYYDKYEIYTYCSRIEII